MLTTSHHHGIGSAAVTQEIAVKSNVITKNNCVTLFSITNESNLYP